MHGHGVERASSAVGLHRPRGPSAPPARAGAEVPTAPALSAARWTAIAATFVNLGIHLSLAPAHIGEMPYVGVLFVIASLVLGAVMVGLASDHDSMRTPAWIVGSIVCALELILFVVSRTSGLPLGYRETWTGSVEDLLGLGSLFVELVFVVCAAASLGTEPRTAPGRRAVAWLPWHDRTAPLG